MASGLAGVLVHSAGFVRLERDGEGKLRPRRRGKEWPRRTDSPVQCRALRLRIGPSRVSLGVTANS